MPAPGWTRRSSRLRLRRFGSARPEFLPLEPRVLPAVFTVNSFTDGADANLSDNVALTLDGRTTLRAAIQQANAMEGTHTIVLPAGNYVLSIAGAGEDAGATGDLDISGPIVVQGAGPGTTTVTGDGTDRVFDIRSSRMITIRDLTVTGG